MKTLAKLLLSSNSIMMLFTYAVPAQAQQNRPSTPATAHVVTYSDELTTGMPNLKHAVVALNFSGTLKMDAQKTLMKKHGVRHFSEGPNPCRLPGQDVLCFSFGKPVHVPFSGSGSSSNSGRGSSYSESVSQSGNYYAIPVFATLIHADGTSIELGEASSAAFAGQTHSSSSSSGFSVGFRSSSSINSMKPPEAAINTAATRAMMKLIDPVWWRKKAFDTHTNAQWVPGASAEIAAAFGKGK